MNNDELRISPDNRAGLPLPERAAGGALAPLIWLAALTLEALILGVAVTMVLMLGVGRGWWGKHLRQSHSQNPVVIEGEYCVLQSRCAGN